jgi:hypothetical protein
MMLQCRIIYSIADINAPTHISKINDSLSEYHRHYSAGQNITPVSLLDIDDHLNLIGFAKNSWNSDWSFTYSKQVQWRYIRRSKRRSSLDHDTLGVVYIKSSPSTVLRTQQQLLEKHPVQNLS